MAGGVAMYCRRQGYPSPHLINPKIPRHGAQINGYRASSSSGTRGIDLAAWWGYVGFASQNVARWGLIMCGPVYDYSFEDFINDSSQEEWDEWESEAARLELPLDYYIQEFVGQLA